MIPSTPGLDVVVLGAAAMDMLAWVDHLPVKDGITLARKVELQPGGSGANVAIAAARLGLKVGFIARIGSDENGQILLNEFAREKVDTSACHIVEDHPTAICFITIDSNGDRSMVALGGAGPVENCEELDRDYLSRARLFYITDAGHDILQFTAGIALAKNNLLVYSPGGIMTAGGLENLVGVLPGVDVLLLSQSEANSLLPDHPPELAARKLFARGARNVVITLGKQGVVCVTPEQSFSLPVFPVDPVVDTTGAGDALAGGLIAGLLFGDSLKEAIRYGCAAAAIKIAQPGARTGLPTREEINHFLSLHPLE